MNDELIYTPKILEILDRMTNLIINLNEQITLLNIKINFLEIQMKGGKTK